MPEALLKVENNNPRLQIVDEGVELVLDSTDVKLISVGMQGPQGTTGQIGPQGPQGDPGINGVGDLTYVHTQSSAATVWTINHNLGKYPTVTVIDSGDNVVIGDVTYLDINNLTVEFSAAFGGKAILN